MAVNRDKPDRWKADIAQSVDLYNDWFLRFAPVSFREIRSKVIKNVEDALAQTNNLLDVSSELLAANPQVLATLRMATAPPIARDRLVGLAGVSPTLVRSMEIQGRIPPQMARSTALEELDRIALVLKRLADIDIFSWLETGRSPSHQEVHRAATIIADRLCGAVADPEIRNAQERRQLAYIRDWLESRGYRLTPRQRLRHDQMPPGTFAFRLIVPAYLEDGSKRVNIPIDVAIQPRSSDNQMPILVEAKSAGDFTNTNKRRKEEAIKMAQLRNTYGQDVQFILFLCGYFDTGYLGYEAAEGIDWVWEHRIEDLAEFGI